MSNAQHKQIIYNYRTCTAIEIQNFEPDDRLHGQGYDEIVVTSWHRSCPTLLVHKDHWPVL